MRYEIKQLGLGGILDHAINLTRNHFGTLIGITLVLQVPLLLITNFGVLALTPEIKPGMAPEQMMQAQLEMVQNPLFWGFTAGGNLLYVLVAMPITNAAVIYAIARSYLGKPIGVGESMRRAVGIFLPLLWTWFLSMLAVMGGLLLCVIPGILFALYFAVHGQVVVLEGLSGVRALQRSKQLMKDNLGNVFVLGLLLFAIGAGLGIGASLIPQQHVQIVARVFVQAVATVLGAAAVVVLYFSARCQHENFDLTLLAESVGEAAPAAASEEAWPEAVTDEDAPR